MDINVYPLLIFIRGLPGSGKSYLTRPLQQAIQAAYNRHVVVLDPDAIDFDSPAYAEHVARQTAEGVEPALHAYRFLRGQAYQAIAGRDIVIWNQPFSNLEIFNKMVSRMHEQAAQANTEARIVVVEVTIDPTVAQERTQARKAAGGHGPSETTFGRFVRDYHSFAGTEYQIISVPGDAAVETSVAQIMAGLQPLL